MNEFKFFLKKILTYFPILNKFIRKIYNNYRDVTFFIPLEKNLSAEENVLKKFYRLNLKNFNKLKVDNEYFIIFKEKSIKNYSIDKLKNLKDLIIKHKADIAYDGDDQFNTEITSRKVIEYYLKKFPNEKYPYRFFYIKENFNIKNIGSMHRLYNFNATFNLPSGGRSIGDGGAVENRLKYIPDLSGKSFLDIGSEEGYAVFDAINKNAKFAKGLNINEVKEYDFFPDYSRPVNQTSRKRSEIDKTKQFLIKEYGLKNSEKIKFDYNNIYNIGEEKFDFVFCFGVLYHLKNPYLALENLFKVTKETLVIETQGIKDEKYLNAGISTEDGFIRHSSGALSYLLKRVGFKKVEVLLVAYDKDTLVEKFNDQSNVQNIVLRASK